MPDYLRAGEVCLVFLPHGVTDGCQPRQGSESLAPERAVFTPRDERDLSGEIIGGPGYSKFYPVSVELQHTLSCARWNRVSGTARRRGIRAVAGHPNSYLNGCSFTQP
jgi:hypothetical protein